MAGRSEGGSHSGHSTWALLHTGHSLERANIFSLAVGYAAGTGNDDAVSMKLE